MDQIEQVRAAEEPLKPYTGAHPRRRRRRIVMSAIAGLIVIGFVLCAVAFVSLNGKIHRLDSTVTAQSRQIAALESRVEKTDSSLNAAVACLQTVGSAQGLCTKLVK